MTKPPSARQPKGGRWPKILAWLSALALLAALLLMGGAGPAYRTELLGLGGAFSLLRYGAYLAVAAATLGVVVLVLSTITRRPGAGIVAVSVLVGTAALLYMPWQQWQRAQQVPVIHDITTDTQNPPTFDALRDVRASAPNGVDYPGGETARKQQDAYPEVQPLVVAAPLSRVLSAVQSEVESAGWQIAAVNDRTLEATAETRWFGFKDDVVIRLSDAEDGVRVDMRSASRLGASDVGTNARRIEDFLDGLEERLE